MDIVKCCSFQKGVISVKNLEQGIFDVNGFEISRSESGADQWLVSDSS